MEEPGGSSNFGGLITILAVLGMIAVIIVSCVEYTGVKATVIKSVGTEANNPGYGLTVNLSANPSTLSGDEPLWAILHQS